MPVLFGSGVRLFDELKATPILLDGPDLLVEGSRVTHLPGVVISGALPLHTATGPLTIRSNPTTVPQADRPGPSVPAVALFRLQEGWWSA